LDKKILDTLISKDSLIEENLKKFGDTKLPDSQNDIDRKINLINRDKPVTFKLFSNKKDSEEKDKMENEPPSVMTQQLLPDLDSIDDSIDEVDIIIDDSEGTEEIPELEEAIVERNEMLEPAFKDNEISNEVEEEEEETVVKDEDGIELIVDEENEETPELVEESEKEDIPDLKVDSEKEEIPELVNESENEETNIEEPPPSKIISEEQFEPGINREIVRKIYACLNKIYSGVNLSELISNAKRAIKDLINSDSVEVVLINEKSYSMQKLITKEAKTITDIYNLADGLTGACATQKKTLNYDRPTEDDRYNSKIDQPGNAGLKRILYFPVINDAGETVAVIQGARENKKFSEDEISYLTMISKQLDTAISRAATLENHIVEEKLNVAQKLREIITQEITGPI
ncbi:MAG: GAF domain-containing protein, partial [Ignavibacteriaceae bacterium]